MSFLLDGLHEDLNRVKEKPVTSPVECDGHSKADDAMMADKAWEVYRKRNNSFFVDYFQGQFKSTLVCPVCQNVNILIHSRVLYPVAYFLSGGPEGTFTTPSLLLLDLVCSPSKNDKFTV